MDLPGRPAAEGAIFLPLDAALASPEATAIPGDALQSMVDEARPRGYSMLIKIRSRLDDACAPRTTEYEREVNRKRVSVKLQAWLATTD